MNARRKRRRDLERWRKEQAEIDYGWCVNCGVPLCEEYAYVSNSGDGYFCRRCVIDENRRDDEYEDDQCFDDEWYDGDEIAECPICSAMMTYETCWQCGGEGGYHDCGEDCCVCLDGEEITHDCPECKGEGGYLQCSALPHTDEQMKAYRERKAWRERAT